MYQAIRKNIERNKYLLTFLVFIVFFFLVSVVYKNDSSLEEVKSAKISSIDENDFKTIKEFFFKQIKSPFINVSHEIKSGDTIGKILKKYKVESNQIQAVINQYKKYSKPNQLLVGNKIDLVIE